MEGEREREVGDGEERQWVSEERIGKGRGRKWDIL